MFDCSDLSDRGDFLAGDPLESTYEIVIVGTTVFTPPIEVLMAIAERFPTLDFVLEGTTEHFNHERWSFKGNVTERTDVWSEDERDGTETWFVRNGVVEQELPKWCGP